MDSSDNNRNTKIPIRLTVTSELEPVDCDGFYTETADGFVLEFSPGDDKYEIRHADGATSLFACGLLTYRIDFGGVGEASVSTPFGELNLTVEPRSCNISRADGALTVELSYSLSDGTQTIERSVVVAARFFN